MPSPKPASSTLTRVLLGAAAGLVVAGGAALWLAARFATPEPTDGAIAVTVTDATCQPAELTLPAGRTTFRIHNASDRPLEWEILDGVMVVAERENIALPPLYFAHEREVYERDGMWRPLGPFSPPREDEQVVTRTVRYRTVGDMSCTGAVDSPAASVSDIVAEVAVSTLTERGATRADDRLSEAAMEDRKKEGYF